MANSGGQAQIKATQATKLLYAQLSEDDIELSIKESSELASYTTNFFCKESIRIKKNHPHDPSTLRYY